MGKFTDGLKDFLAGFANTRSALARNAYQEQPKLGREQLRAIYKLGIMAKTIRLITGYAINDTMNFESDADKKYFLEKMKKPLKQAAKYQMAFGRAIVVIVEKGADLSTPMTTIPNKNRLKFQVFSGDEVTALDISRDLNSNRYYKPRSYQVRGYQFHWTRVIDFTYYEPIELEKSEYFYGGISFPELVYPQLINDSVVERATGSIVEKNATLFYKVEGFKQNLANKQEKAMLEYFGNLENARSIYGAGLIDMADDVEVVNQTLGNLSETNDITLRRFAMVSGVPLPFLIGENVKGLNSSGDTERDTLNDTAKAHQDDYLIEPINEWFDRLGMGRVTFKESIGMNASEQASYETKVIDNAAKLTLMGEDGAKYLEEKGVVTPDPFDMLFPEVKEEESDLVQDPELALTKTRLEEGL